MQYMNMKSLLEYNAIHEYEKFTFNTMQFMNINSLFEYNAIHEYEKFT